MEGRIARPSSSIVRSGLQTARQRVLNKQCGTGTVWFLAPDGPQSTRSERRTGDATTPSTLDVLRSRRRHVQLECLCRPHRHTSRLGPQLPTDTTQAPSSEYSRDAKRSDDAEGTQDGVVDCRAHFRGQVSRVGEQRLCSIADEVGTHRLVTALVSP